MSDSEVVPERALPDLADPATQANRYAAGLDWVGMGRIEVPVRIALGPKGLNTVPARVDAAVNLQDRQARGIHMSRLYLQVDQSLAQAELSPPMLRALLSSFLASHAGLSTRARIALNFESMLRRPALASGLSGWRAYPTRIDAVLDERGFRVELALELLYSSTCPCSAALARQLIQEQFASDFAASGSVDAAAVWAWLGSSQGIVATPHSQRSRLELRVALDPERLDFPIIELVDRLESALQTPVQTAVKRLDEQAFTRLNGQNLMFVEDAARRVQQALSTAEVLDFWARVSHLESLHAHDAVAIVVKGVLSGYSSNSDCAPWRG